MTAAAFVGRKTVEITLDNYRSELRKTRHKGSEGVGTRTLEKIREFLETGNVQKLQVLEAAPNAVAMNDLTQVWGIGHKMAERLIALGISKV
jgi:DNA polymerase/3'-5' exonuclease PolX